MLTMHEPITRDRQGHTSPACARGFDAALDEGVGCKQYEESKHLCIEMEKNATQLGAESQGSDCKQPPREALVRRHGQQKR